MRLWHYSIIKYLPNTQLLLLWKTLNSIYKKEPIDILNNYVQNCSLDDLHLYSLIVIKELNKRQLEVNLDNFYSYFNISENDTYIYSKEIKCPFNEYHDIEYLLICYYALEEIYIRGQDDFDRENFYILKDFIYNIVIHGGKIL